LGIGWAAHDRIEYTLKSESPASTRWRWERP
jgi:hypothetical protein